MLSLKLSNQTLRRVF